MKDNTFYIVEKESGAESNDIPLWASKIQNPAKLDEESALKPTIKVIEEVPGAFQILNVLSLSDFGRVLIFLKCFDRIFWMLLFFSNLCRPRILISKFGSQIDWPLC